MSLLHLLRYVIVCLFCVTTQARCEIDVKNNSIFNTIEFEESVESVDSVEIINVATTDSIVDDKIGDGLEIVKNSLQLLFLKKLKSVYVLSNSSNEQCRNASRVYSLALDEHESWALKCKQ